VSTATVYRLCKLGDLQYFRISNALLVSADDLAMFLETQHARGTASGRSRKVVGAPKSARVRWRT